MKKLFLLSSALLLILPSCKSDSSNTSLTIGNSATTEATQARSRDQHSIWPPASKDRVANPLKENYLVVLDDSGSMNGARIKQAKRALTRLVSVLPKEHNLSLMFFNSEVRVPFGTDNREAFTQAVNGADANGGTPLAASTRAAYLVMREQAARQAGYGAYHLIIVTDGQASDRSPMPLVKEIVKNTSIQVHVVGFHLDDHEMNDARFVDYKTARNSDELVEAFKAVAAETNEFTDPKEFTR